MLTEIWRYPVKTCGGERLTAVPVTANSLDEDRSWAFVDNESGHVASAKRPSRWARLLEVKTEFVDGELMLRLPDGDTGSTGDLDRLNGLVSTFVGRGVSLQSAAAITEAVIERTDPDVDLLLRETKIELGGVATFELGSESATGTVFDFAPIHLIAAPTLAALEQLGESTSGDPRRYRPNLVVDVDGPPFMENDWPGRHLQIGEDLVLKMMIPSPRCVVPSLAQPDVPRSAETLRTVAANNRIEIEGFGHFNCVGAYASVVKLGTVAVGDRVELGGPEA